MAIISDYTSRDRFTELEQEYEAFQKFFKKQWEFTKKEIRKTILWTKDPVHLFEVDSEIIGLDF